MALADPVIVWIVGRGHFDHAGPEGGVDEIVSDDGDFPPRQGQHRLLADEVRVPRIFRMNSDCSVAEHRLGTRRCDREEISSFSRQRIPDIIELPLLFGVVDLIITDGGVILGTPVHDVLPAIDQPLLVKTDERLPHSGREGFVHRKPLSFPIAGCAQGPELLHDDAAVLPSPFPYTFDEFLPPEIVAGLSFFGQRTFHDMLCGDSCVIRSGNPAGLEPGHPLVPDQSVLQGRVEDMTHVQDACDIRRRDDDGVRIPGRLDGSVEESGALPAGIPFPFNLARGIDFRRLCLMRFVGHDLRDGRYRKNGVLRRATRRSPKDEPPLHRSQIPHPVHQVNCQRVGTAFEGVRGLIGGPVAFAVDFRNDYVIVNVHL